MIEPENSRLNHLGNQACTTAPDDEEVLAALADDFMTRYRRGENPSVEAVAANYPLLAGRIRNILSAVSAIEQTHGLDPLAGEGPGATIGRYKLLERIGEGGFGIVYMAEQQQPIRRKIALKVIKPGLDTRQVIARFEAERQALALMNHENIAKVLDAGATGSGRPYFVMELVRGVPITEFCDTNQLSLKDRLELFMQVCRAVQHAHMKGIIHRDIKPTNVLVTLNDGIPVPKVIDFGVAKAIDSQLTEKTLFTNFAQLVGTPLYMSPEQAEMTSVDVDTRSDVYSLGVLLYELLTGTTPVDKEYLKRAAFDEVRRVIREHEPPRPSTRLSSLGAAARCTISAQRKSEPNQLGQLMRGELDWIVMKALAKERGRRYETADALARDVDRYLLDEPVEACPPSTLYRMHKFARRNTGPVLAAALVVLTLIGGVIGTTFGLVRAEQASQAHAERAEGERRAKEEAQTRLAQIEKGAELLATVFRDMDPLVADNAGLSYHALLRKRLAAAAQQLEGEAVGDPLIVARLQHVLGISLTELGLREQAAEVLAEAARIREQLLGADHLDTAATKHYLATAYRDDGDDALAELLYKEAIAVRAAKLGADHPETLTSRHYLGMVYANLGKHAQAEALLKDVLAIRSDTLGAEHPDTLATQHRLAVVYQSQGKYDLSESLLKKVLTIRTDTLGGDHLHTIATKASLARLYNVQSKLELAEPLSKETLAVRTAKLGANHPDTIISKRSLALLYRSMNKLEQAVPLLEEALRSSKTHMPSATLEIQTHLALAYCDAGRSTDAVPLLEDVLATNTATLGADHWDTVVSRDNLALQLRSLKKVDRSIPLLEESFRFRKAQIGPDHPEMLGRQVTLGACYCEVGRFADGIALIEDVRRKGRQDPHPTWVGRVLLTAYAQAGMKTETMALANELARALRELPADSLEIAARLAEAGQSLVDAEAYAVAEPMLRESLSIAEKQASDGAVASQVKSLLGAALLGQQKFAEAEPVLLSSFEGLRDVELQHATEIGNVRTRQAVERLVRLYDAWEKPETAAIWREELEGRALGPPAEEGNRP